MTRPIVWATVDRTAGVALITGKGHDVLVHEVAPRSRWSRAGRGWVVTLSELSDLACLCEERGAIYREKLRAV